MGHGFAFWRVSESFEPDGAHLRDIFPTIPQTVESCALAGVLGATTAVVGSLMATEVLKFVSGLPTAAVLC